MTLRPPEIIHLEDGWKGFDPINIGEQDPLVSLHDAVQRGHQQTSKGEPFLRQHQCPWAKLFRNELKEVSKGCEEAREREEWERKK